MTLRKFSTRWLDSRRARLAPRTIESYQALLSGYVFPLIGSKDLEKIRPKHIRECCSTPLNDGHTRTAEQVYTLLCQILRAAIRSGHLKSFAFEKLDRPEHNAIRTAWWSPEDAARFIRTRQLALDPHLVVWILALCLGLRRGELCGLKWSDFNFASGTVAITRQRVTLADGRTIVTHPKTKSSVRMLPISEDLASVLRPFCKNPSEYVALSATTGQPITPSGLDQAWRRAVIDCAPHIPYITLHGLRHTCGAAAVRAGVSMRVLQEIMGHSSMTVTADIYAHADRRIIQSAVDKICAVLLS